jgi:hypothetical protein
MGILQETVEDGCNFGVSGIELDGQLAGFGRAEQDGNRAIMVFNCDIKIRRIDERYEKLRCDYAPTMIKISISYSKVAAFLRKGGDDVSRCATSR